MLGPTFFSLCLLCSPGGISGVETTTVPQEEGENWIRNLLPLPHQIEIHEKVTLPPEGISIVLRPNAGEIEENAANMLRRFLSDRTGSKGGGADFEIVVGVVEESAPELVRHLKEVPNCDQAYIIRPEGNERLILTGLGEKGIYYAAVTFTQLLEPFIAQESVTIPLAEVLDWPDIEERGLWLFSDPSAWIPWMSSLKLNWGEIGTSKPTNIEKGKKNRILIEKDRMMKARLMAFKYHPFIYHYNFLEDWGLFKAYPELAGVGDGALSGRYVAHKMGTSQHRVPCASKPQFREILTEWMTDLASQGVEEVSCWLSERPAQCGCNDCTAVGQFVLEARASVEAWQETRKTYPQFMIRLFLSTTTDERYHKVLAEAPPEVKLERACANWIERVPHIPRDLHINPLFDCYADQGRWLASYDVPIGAYGRVDTPEVKVPCSCAHRIRDFIVQLHARKWRGAYGMMAWDNFMRGGQFGKEIYGFNINALAEWCWNVDGRSEREFAIAWATRQGYEDPEAVAEWLKLMGPVEFDVYDSEFPVCYTWGQATEMVDKRERPVLGEGMFRYYRSPDDFDRKINACQQALEIARGFHDSYLADETQVVQSYVKLAKSVYEVAEIVATDELRTLESQERLRLSLEALTEAGESNVAALKNWRAALGPEPWHFRFHDACAATKKTVQGITEIVAGKYFY